MDEPFDGLDINIKTEIINLFFKLWNKDKKTVVFVSHNIDDISTLANNLYILSNKPIKITRLIKIGNFNKPRNIFDSKSNKLRKEIIQQLKNY
jgi:ABC-type nitrate/sulfonate/bicarbonate transport system ATPase subunit